MSTLNRCTGWPSTMRNTGLGVSCSRRRQNETKISVFHVPVKVENRSFPCRVTAEIMLTVERAPVEVTTGVRPTGAQVVPA